MAGERMTKNERRCFRCGQSHPDTFACPADSLTSKERSNELRAFADVLRDTGRYGVDFADVERASLLSGAADELDRQRAEIELLTKQRDRDVMYIADMEDTISRAAKALGVTNSDALLEKLENPAHETGNDPGVILNELWSACRVVFYPELDDLRGNYPIEHAPGAAKDARDLIEARLAERILQRAKSSQKAGDESK